MNHESLRLQSKYGMQTVNHVSQLKWHNVQCLLLSCSEPHSRAKVRTGIVCCLLVKFRALLLLTARSAHNPKIITLFVGVQRYDTLYSHTWFMQPNCLLQSVSLLQTLFGVVLHCFTCLVAHQGVN